MSISNGYATLAQVKARQSTAITDSNDDAILERCVEAASRQIDAFCNRRFWLDGSTSARTYKAADALNLYLDDFDAATAITLKTDDNDDGTFETTWTVDTDYVLAPVNTTASGITRPYWHIRATGTRYFPRNGYRNQVQVTAKWGWPAVPTPITEACLIIATDLYKNRDAQFGVTGIDTFGSPIRVRDNGIARSLIKDYVIIGGWA